MTGAFSILVALLSAMAPLALQARAETRVPAFTAYLDPDPRGAKLSKEGISGWTNPKITMTWFGEIKTAGKLTAGVVLRLPKDRETRLRLSVGEQAREVTLRGTGETQTAQFGEFSIAKTSYVRFQLASLNPAGANAGDVEALVLYGPAAADAHFNLDPRRNAASVHLNYAVPKDAEVALFRFMGIEQGRFFLSNGGFVPGFTPFGQKFNRPPASLPPELPLAEMLAP